MYKLVLSLLLLLCVPCSANDLHYVFAGRNVVVHIPPGKGPYPVVVLLHGGGSNSSQIIVQSAMFPNADRAVNHCTVVVPNGTGPIVNGVAAYTWNAGLCCGTAMLSNVDDVGYIKALLADLPKHLTVDPKRTYVTGMSNGGMMAYRLVVDLPDTFAAGASVATTMGINLNSNTKPIPFMEIHGLLDNNAPYNGGVGSNAQQNQPGGAPDHHSVANTVEQWTPIDGYDPNTPVVTKGGTFIEYLYKGTKANFDLYALPKGGHTWPGGVDITKALNTGPLVSGFNADEYQLKFFSQYHK